MLFSHHDVILNFYFIYLKFSSLKQDPQQRLAANELKEIIEVMLVFTFILLNLHMSFEHFKTFQKGTRPFSADLTKVSHSDLLKEREENYRKAMEREKMEKEKYQREIEETKQKLSELTPIQVN